MKRTAFSLIELIFSIVVIGIAFLSIPAIMSVVNRAAEATVQTKGYYHALAQMGIILSKPWDEANADDWKKANITYILDTATSVCASSKLGLYLKEDRRQCDNNGTSKTPSYQASAIGKNGESDGNFNDIDDFNGDIVNNNIEGFSLSVAVSYTNSQPADLSATYNPPNFTIPSGAPTSTTDIKEVNVTLTDSTTDTNATLRYYGFNIGYDALLTKEQD